MNREALRRYPVVPEDFHNGTATRSVARACTAIFFGEVRGKDPENIVKSRWSGDDTALLLTRAAVSPTSAAATSALAQTITAGFLRSVAPTSAAVRLFEKSLQLDFRGVYRFVFNYPTGAPIPVFVAEGAPMPVAILGVGTTSCGPVRKLAIASALTSELANGSDDNAVNIIANVLSDQTAKSFDAAVFDSQPESSTRPAGLLNGVVPLTADAGGAISKDLGQIAKAIAASGGNPENLVIIAGAQAATVLRYAASPNFSAPVFATISVPTDTVVGIDATAIASGTEGVPVIELARESTIHMEDTSPLAIATGAQGSGVVATPARNVFQTDSLALRVRLMCTWAVLRTGAVQVVTGVKW